MLGFIFFRGSPRCVTPEGVRAILAGLEGGRAGLITVGVFVDEPFETVRQVLDFCGLDAAQLHGDERPDTLEQLAGRAYKALRPAPGDAAEALAQRYALPDNRRRDGQLPALLIDAFHPQLRGGSGRTADWALAGRLARRHPLLLAGGLTPANVTQAVRAVQPWGVDVSSGVESAPGHKDHAALAAFIAAVRQLSSQASFTAETQRAQRSSGNISRKDAKGK
jgi:phosphoribosylanthranilate isomerase